MFLWKGEIWTQIHTKGRWYKERKGETKWCWKLLEAKVIQQFRRERKANHSARPIKFCLIDFWKLGCTSWSVFFSSYKSLKHKVCVSSPQLVQWQGSCDLSVTLNICQWGASLWQKAGEEQQQNLINFQASCPGPALLPTLFCKEEIYLNS